MGRLVILGGGGSGSGKTTLQQMLVSRRGFVVLRGVTCRPPRPHERNGVDYHFLTADEFDAASQRGDLAEETVYAGVRYGILKTDLDAAVASDADYVTVVNTDGVRALRAYLGADRVVAVCVDAEDVDVLRRRLTARGERHDVIARRLQWAETVERTEAYRAVYDHRIVNVDGRLDDAYAALEACLTSDARVHNE
jgi:guanylate kinase